MKTKFVCVSPITPKAKRNFDEIMLKFHSCRVKEEQGTKMYLESLNKMYYFWMDKKSDPDWRLEK